MFIKRDLRKIDEILANEEGENRSILKFSNRKAEFDGSIRVLCRESRLHSLSSLNILNLYGNDIADLSGIGMLGSTPIVEINLGSNRISSIPLEFASLASTMKKLWLDDNQLEVFPIAICQLVNLTELRLSGNELKSLPLSISSLSDLHTLAVDNNLLTSFPQGCLNLRNLKELWLRQNKIQDIPADIGEMEQLEVLSISSNLLAEIPSSLANVRSLKKLYANGNSIKSVAKEVCTMPSIQHINLANNRLERLPQEWTEVWGPLDPSSGMIGPPSSGAGAAAGDTRVCINLIGNTIVDNSMHTSVT